MGFESIERLSIMSWKVITCKERASKDAHLCHNVVTRVKIIYIFHMLSDDYAKMNNF